MGTCIRWHTAWYIQLGECMWCVVGFQPRQGRWQAHTVMPRNREVTGCEVWYINGMGRLRSQQREK